jgi:ribosomal protein S18 acetylase RimI-like enzyme
MASTHRFPITIQSAETQHYPTIINLLNDLALYEGGICALDIEKLIAAIAQENPRLTILVAIVSKQNKQEVIGCALSYAGYDVLSATHGSHISDIVVRHDMRGNNIGTQLIARIAADTLNRGGEWLSWTVAHSNAYAKQFYLKRGAVEVGVDFMAMGLTAMRTLSKNIVEI